MLPKRNKEKWVCQEDQTQDAATAFAPYESYVGLILEAIPSIANAASKIKTKRQRRTEAREEFFANILEARAYEVQQAQQLQQAQIAAQVAAQNTARKQVNEKNERRMKLVITIGGIGLLSLTMWYIYLSHQGKSSQALMDKISKKGMR